MRYLILYSCTIILILCTQFSFSQSISSEVISNSGEQFKNAGVSLNWTLGESVTDVLQSGPYIHTQGFHQTYSTATNVNPDMLNSSVLVYPNPCQDFLQVKLKQVKQKVSIELYDPSGRMIEQKEDLPSEGFRLNMSQYAEGKYVLRVITDQSTTFGIVKSSN